MLDMPVYDALRRVGSMEHLDDIVPINIHHIAQSVFGEALDIPEHGVQAFPAMLYEWRGSNGEPWGVYSLAIDNERRLNLLGVDSTGQILSYAAATYTEDGDARWLDPAASARMRGFVDENFDVIAGTERLLNYVDVLVQCKNVQLQDIEPDWTRQQRRRRQRQGIEPYTFKVIQVDPQRTTTVGRGTSHRDLSNLTPLHIVRGNFATYTEDRPLFGRYTGTFWRPAHVRGSAAAGLIEHAYEVKSPE